MFGHNSVLITSPAVLGDSGKSLNKTKYFWLRLFYEVSSESHKRPEPVRWDIFVDKLGPDKQKKIVTP